MESWQDELEDRAAEAEAIQFGEMIMVNFLDMVRSIKVTPVEIADLAEQPHKEMWLDVCEKW